MAYVISTPRLEIHPFGPEHIHDEYVNWLNDPSLMKFSQNKVIIHMMIPSSHQTDKSQASFLKQHLNINKIQPGRSLRKLKNKT